ncbi:MAG: response regulator [Armatimonadetes bacterium]|nr:response regulator [Armatimonadota bacterium]
MSDEIHILVLEDDDDLRENLAAVLEYEGFHVVAVGRGVDAVEQARDHAFDLVVADIRMKGISGLDALEQVRGHQPEIRSLVVTGYSTEADSIRAIRLGVGEYLKKPFDSDTFMEAVRRLVAQRREQQKARAREQALRRTTLIALEALARTLNPGLVGAGRLAARLAAECGAAPEIAEEVGLAAIVTGLQRSHPESEPGMLLEALSPGVRRMAAEAADFEDAGDGAAVSLEATCAVLARFVIESGNAAAVAQAHPGRFHETLLNTLERLSADDRPGTRSGAPEAAAGPRRAPTSRAWRAMRRLERGGRRAAGLAALRPEHVDELSGALWLLPWLLERPTRGDIEERAVRRLIRDFPAEAQRLQGELSVSARAAMADVLALTSGARAQAILQQLATDSDGGVRAAAAAALQKRGVEAPQVPRLRIHSLGAFEVYRGDERVPERDWQGRNVRHLLAYLAQAARPVPVEVLLEQFWPDHLETGRKILTGRCRSCASACAPPTVRTTTFCGRGRACSSIPSFPTGMTSPGSTRSWRRFARRSAPRPPWGTRAARCSCIAGLIWRTATSTGPSTSATRPSCACWKRRASWPAWRSARRRGWKSWRPRGASSTWIRSIRTRT